MRGPSYELLEAIIKWLLLISGLIIFLICFFMLGFVLANFAVSAS